MKKITQIDVFLFIPNVIGYIRIILGIISFYYMDSDHVKAVTCYLSSVLLDEFDGTAARRFNQISKFGATMDTITDMMLSTGMLMTLSRLYPDYAFLCQVHVALCAGSNWIITLAPLMEGGVSHRSADFDNSILKFYYSSWLFLTALCIGNEVFMSMIYLLHFTEGPQIMGVSVFRTLLYLNMPMAVTKIVVHIAKLLHASNRIATIDVNERNKNK